MEAVLSFYPNDATLYFITGKMFRDEKNNEQSIMYFEKTLQMDNQFVAAYYELSTLYALNNELQKSLSILKKLISLQPDQPVAYFRISQIYHFLNNDKKASEWYGYAIENGYELPEKQEKNMKYSTPSDIDE